MRRDALRMRSHFGPALLASLLPVAAALAGDPPTEAIMGVSPIGELAPTSPVNSSGFGTASASANDLLFVGAPILGETPPTLGAGGRVWIFRRDAAHGGEGEWSPVGTLNDGLSPAGTLDRFGAAIAFEPPWLAVGAPGVDRVWLWRMNGDGSAASEPQSFSGAAGSRFGVSLVFVGQRLAIGAPAANNGQGSVTLLLRSGERWSTETTVTSPTPAPNEEFGFALDGTADGALLAVGLPGATTAGVPLAGRAELFALNGTRWSLASTLTFESLYGSGRFGAAIAFNPAGTRLAIGAPTSVPPALLGAVRVVERSDRGWSPVMTSVGGATLGFYGGSIAWNPTVAESPETLAVGAPGRLVGAFTPPFPSAPGRVRIIAPPSIETLTTLFDAEGLVPLPYSGFGVSVAWTASGLFVGIPEGSSAADPASGRGRAFRLGALAGDCDRDGIANATEATTLNDCDGDLVPDACDFALADCDGDGVLDRCEAASAAQFLGGAATGVSISLLPSKPYECALVNRLVVPEGSTGIVDGIIARFASLQPGASFRLAIWNDPIGSGLPYDAELRYEAPIAPVGVLGDQRFAIPPIAIGPAGTPYLVGIAWTVPGLGPTSALRGNGPPFTNGASYFFTGPLGLDLTDPASMIIGSTEWTLPTVHPRVGATLRSASDLDGDGIPDSCACPADLDRDGTVGASDLAILLGAWGDGGADLDGDGAVGASDLAVLLGAWGGC
jgi:hypothetical protein